MLSYWLCLMGMTILSQSITPDDMDMQIRAFVDNRSIMGIALQITRNSRTVYRANMGYRDYQRELPVDNSTMFRMASLSKSFTSCGILLLVEQGKLSLADTIDQLLGYSVVNPSFPEKRVTVEMLLSHQSSILDCDAYDDFVDDIDSAEDGFAIPNLSQIIVKGGKYYNECTFIDKAPGTYYQYGNLNYVIAGTIIERLTNTRFDVWMRSSFLGRLGALSFNPADMPNPNDLAAMYRGEDGQWVATLDNYNGSIKQRNLTGYQVGTNAGIYRPSAHIRASTDELLRYSNMLRTGGTLENGTRLLAVQSVRSITRPRYQYHGAVGGDYDASHAYGLGLGTYCIYPNDFVLRHRVTVGHTGSGNGLISANYYSGEWAFAYAINGILGGYTDTDISIYVEERLWINSLVDQFISSQEADS